MYCWPDTVRTNNQGVVITDTWCTTALQLNVVLGAVNPR